MRTWSFLLGGLLVWTVHFFGIYIFASVWLDTMVTRVLTLVLTLLCLAADAVLLHAAARALRKIPADELDRWIALVAALGVALSCLAVLWQGLPGLLA